MLRQSIPISLPFAPNGISPPQRAAKRTPAEYRFCVWFEEDTQSDLSFVSRRLPASPHNTSPSRKLVLLWKRVSNAARRHERCSYIPPDFTLVTPVRVKGLP